MMIHVIFPSALSQERTKAEAPNTQLPNIGP